MSYISHADLGGRQVEGNVLPEAEGELWHASWEPRVLALTLAMGATGAWNIDQSRSARETLPDYATLSYYRIWLAGLQRLLEERELVSEDELAAGHAQAVFPRVCRQHPVVRPQKLAQDAQIFGGIIDDQEGSVASGGHRVLAIAKSPAQSNPYGYLKCVYVSPDLPAEPSEQLPVPDPAWGVAERDRERQHEPEQRQTPRLPSHQQHHQCKLQQRAEALGLAEIERVCPCVEGDDAKARGQHQAAPVRTAAGTPEDHRGHPGQSGDVKHAQDVDQQAATAKVAMAVLVTQGGLGCGSRRRPCGAR